MKSKQIVVEVLYTDACPFWKQTLATVNEVINELNLKEETTVKQIKITDEEEAKRRRFLGSPTVRINGVDIDPQAQGKQTTQGYIGCRIYTYEGQMSEQPPKQMIKTALRQTRAH